MHKHARSYEILLYQNLVNLLGVFLFFSKYSYFINVQNKQRDARRSLLSQNRSVSSNLTVLLRRCQGICCFFHFCHTKLTKKTLKHFTNSPHFQPSCTLAIYFLSDDVSNCDVISLCWHTTFLWMGTAYLHLCRAWFTPLWKGNTLQEEVNKHCVSIVWALKYLNWTYVCGRRDRSRFYIKFTYWLALFRAEVNISGLK